MTTERASGLAPLLEVEVPASTSNLGPGFDFLGLALSLKLRVRILGPTPGGQHLLERLEGTAAEWPQGAENHLLRAFDLVAARTGEPARHWRFSAASEIPIARGLGSSGAAVAAGLLLAAAIRGRPTSVEDLLAWGCEVEGHPDNSTAALLGGCTLGVPSGNGRLHVVRQPLHEDLAFAAAWPARRVPTEAARAALPREVPFADAVENPRRLALLLEGLRCADPELLRAGEQDRLHVPYRLPLVPGAASALAAARSAGAWLSTISGSGSGLFAIGPRDRIGAVARAMEGALRAADGEAQSRVLVPVLGSPRVLRPGSRGA